MCVALCTQLTADDSVVVQNPVPNAYTLAIGGRKPFIVVHTALLELLEPLEVQVNHAAFCLSSQTNTVPKCDLTLVKLRYSLH